MTIEMLVGLEEERGPVGRAGGAPGPKDAATGRDDVVFESCTCTWVFDTTRARFRRVLKGLDMPAEHAVTAWRPYYGLSVDEGSEAFTVHLNPEGTRLLRSWRHVGRCAQCGGGPTPALSPGELSSPVLG